MSDDRTIPVSAELLDRLRDYALTIGDMEMDDQQLFNGAYADARAIGALLVQPLTEEPAPDAKAEYKRLLAEYHRLGDWLMAHPLEAAFMPHLLKPVDPDEGPGDVLTCDINELSGWLDACLDGIDRTHVSSIGWLREFQQFGPAGRLPDDCT